MKLTKHRSPIQNIGSLVRYTYRITDSDGFKVILYHEEAIELYNLLDKALTVTTNTATQQKPRNVS